MRPKAINARAARMASMWKGLVVCIERYCHLLGEFAPWEQKPEIIPDQTSKEFPGGATRRARSPREEAFLGLELPRAFALVGMYALFNLFDHLVVEFRNICRLSACHQSVVGNHRFVDPFSAGV